MLIEVDDKAEKSKFEIARGEDFIIKLTVGEIDSCVKSWSNTMLGKHLTCFLHVSTKLEHTYQFPSKDISSINTHFFPG